MKSSSVLKGLAQRIGQRLGFDIASTDRLGLSLEVDLARLTADAPLETIFDIGANVGQTARRFATAYPTATIYSFEPVPTSFSRLNEVLNRHRNVKAFNIAVGSVPGQAEFNVAEDSARSSLKVVAGISRPLVVPVDTVDRFCQEHRIADIDLMKIDAEGYEMEVLQGAVEKLKGQVRYIYVECVFGSCSELTHTSIFDLQKFLDKRGFCLFSYYPESFYLDLGCAMGNALFALRDRLPLKVPGAVRNIVTFAGAVS